MRFLVLGSSGMVGHTIALYLKEQGHVVVGFSRKPVSFLDQQVNGDAFDTDLLRALICENTFDVVINCIGILNEFAEQNPSAAQYLNAELPHILADICQDAGTRVFQLSTDCVFAGNTGPYAEASVPDGETVYDRTKAKGELNDSKNLTFRTSVVGPDLNPEGIGLFNWFMRQSGSVKGYTKAMWTGLTTLELAKAMEDAAKGNGTGLVNMVPRNNISKYELLGLFNKHFRDDRISIDRDASVSLDKTLIRTNYDVSYEPKPYERQVIEMAEWITAHQCLYSHYLSDFDADGRVSL